jgi:hypothetical protein
LQGLQPLLFACGNFSQNVFTGVGLKIVSDSGQIRLPINIVSIRWIGHCCHEGALNRHLLFFSSREMGLSLPFHVAGRQQG